MLFVIGKAHHRCEHKSGFQLKPIMTSFLSLSHTHTPSFLSFSTSGNSRRFFDCLCMCDCAFILSPNKKKQNWLPTAATFQKINRIYILLYITHQSVFIVYKEDRVIVAIAGCIGWTHIWWSILCVLVCKIFTHKTPQR